jgi:hypothetical protein
MSSTIKPERQTLNSTFTGTNKHLEHTIKVQLERFYTKDVWGISNEQITNDSLNITG